MVQGESSVPNRIWTYGLPFGPDANCAELVSSEIELARLYRNKLIEIEQQRLNEFRAARREYVPEFAVLADELDDVNAEIEAVEIDIKRSRKLTAARNIAKAREVDPGARVKQTMLTRAVDAEKLDALDALHKRRRELEKAVKPLRKAANKDPRLDNAKSAIKERYRVAMNDAYAKRGCYWSTSEIQKDAIKAATRKRIASGQAPQHKPWDVAISRRDGSSLGGSGSVGVRWVKSVTTDDLLSCTDSMMRIEVGEKLGRNGFKATLAMRVGSDRNGPVWAKFKMVYGRRMLPPGARVKRAWVKRQKVGLHSFKWTLCICMESESFRVPARLPRHACAVNLGWREVDGRIRVAYVVGTDGLKEDIFVPERTLRNFDHAEDLFAKRSLWLNELKEKLEGQVEKLPETWRERFVGWQQSRSPRRFARLAYEMRHVVGVDDPFVALMLEWAKRDQHLGEWALRDRMAAEAHRNEFYRLQAKRLAERYSAIHIDNTDLAKVAMVDDVMLKNDLEGKQRSNRRYAAPSEFKAALVLMCGNSGATLTPAPKGAKNASTCHVCGSPNDQGAAQFVKCEGCGAEYDVDFNHCRNLLGLQHAEAVE